ncbi:MAG: hypothetical protein B6I20_14285 [Bacteroidetes bacterium 4572_117]|nr:MAG: hypothetical protein B6I20_14285 [Bacteroidetes bacterium 4572_117]
MNEKRITVILVDDHQMFRDGLKHLLVGEKIADVIGEASTGKEFLSLIEQNLPDIVLMEGFILKTSGINELKKAISDLANGKSYFSSELLRQIILTMEKNNDNTKSNIPPENKLSKREHEVLEQICNGLSTNEIAEELHISPKTVKGHRTNILSKTACKNTASLVMYSIKNKLVDIEYS